MEDEEGDAADANATFVQGEGAAAAIAADVVQSPNTLAAAARALEEQIALGRQAAAISAAGTERARAERLREQAAAAAATAEAAMSAAVNPFARGGLMRSPAKPVQQSTPQQEQKRLTQPPPPPVIQSPRRNISQQQQPISTAPPAPPPMPFVALSPRALQGAATGAVSRIPPVKPPPSTAALPSLDTRTAVNVPQSGMFRPISAGRPQEQRQAPSRQRFELGESSPPPLGSVPTTPAPYLSRGEIRNSKLLRR